MGKSWNEQQADKKNELRATSRMLRVTSKGSGGD
jgi:hypothetical protein